jgi:exonuclease VII large subunit
MLPDPFKDKAAEWVWAHTPCCREVARLLSREQEAPLPWITRLRMKIHLRFCQLCQRYREQLQMVHRLVRGLAEREARDESEQLSDEAKARIREALKNF